MIAYLFFFHMVQCSFILGQGWLLSNNFCKACQNSSSKFCHSTQCSGDEWIVALLWKLPQMPPCSTNNASLDKNNFDTFYKIDCCAAIHAQTTPAWTKTILTRFTKLIAVQPSMAEYEWTIYQMKVGLSCTEISFVISFFNYEKFGVKTRFLFTQLNQATYSKLGKSSFDMFYKKDCWAVICYPICMTNVSYERGKTVLSFPDISFAILLFVFQRFEIISGFPFLTHTV